MTSKRNLDRRLSDLAAESTQADSDRVPWGLYPEGPERYEAKAAAVEVLRVASHVGDQSLPDDRRENQHARLALLHERFPNAVDTPRDDAVVTTALSVLDRTHCFDVGGLFIGLVPNVPEWWSDDDARAYSEAVEREDTEAAHSLLVGLAYDVMANAGDRPAEVPAA